MIRQLQERYKEKKKMLYHIFVDLEKAFDGVPREVIARALRIKGLNNPQIKSFRGESPTNEVICPVSRQQRPYRD